MIIYRFKPERVAILGPDLACLEWLMECGSTCVKMSDGTEITKIKDMREFIESHGFNLKKLPKSNQIMQPLTDKISQSSNLFATRWEHVPSVYITDIDGSDAAISDEGFNYFLECRALRKLKLNHCDYFTDNAIKILSMGKPAQTLQDLEICLNPWLTDAMVYWLVHFKSLKRAHFYFLPYVANRPAVLRQLRMKLPKAKVTFPETEYIGYGYEGRD